MAGRCQPDPDDPTILGIAAPNHEPLVFEPVKVTNEGWALDAHPRRQLSLAQAVLVLGAPQHRPGGQARPVLVQAAVEAVPHHPSRDGQLTAERSSIGDERLGAKRNSGQAVRRDEPSGA
jgi:hypothetical protein